MSKQLHILFIDNYDSFGFNLVNDFRVRGAKVSVWRNDITATKAYELAKGLPDPSLIVLSPGPGTPGEAGCCIELIKLAQGQIPIFGVCLGHQAIIEAFGGKVGFAGEVVHGKTARVAHDRTGLFKDFSSPFIAARYHSLAATIVPSEFAVTGTCGDIVMAIEHITLPIIGVQFHPESVLTPMGGLLLDAVIRFAQTYACKGKKSQQGDLNA